ncbi:MAG: D-alanyl-D-alanine carboxypeptidase [Thermomonas sp.]|uniref:D-alanyl-D-alanine carboxypeptidase family protein n=1 Tax=Thermomonas sp. TaxID=1971895 RepID=UPI001B76B53D|nr:D-alanyl-D-alanine carboxypeptidase family protein [Thermomonas sp.]MBK6416021.1 D-alanyl-D-alanine carboxypeptidase [Thermomonas sp.]MBK9669912.1 D-alanyl-D-alanine carboxypeptidase [Thermomonas sp.]MBP6438870.1 D-alanyl-D-alanine carboxypeptidase [Thermomonas sp.]MBP7158431.1 D-alanyl-D-alanine carboxypeptidase [Thermomonas sp.]MBP7789331.1 D-alanyl-D-alanine carboxypeptidase [Thermomonas sp.]
MRLRSLLFVALATAGLAFAQTPVPAPAAKPAALSDNLPIPDAPAPATSKAWLVMDYATGEVLAGENVDAAVDPASITKVMTSYVIAAEMAAGKVKPTDQVMMSENAWRSGGAGTDGSYSGFEVNQAAPLVEMEKGMVVQSGNDAAIALAEHVAGSEAAFAQLMNAYAKKIGMTRSHFVNPHGLTAEGHVTTARDLAILGRALIRDFPEAYSYNKIKELTVGPITQPNRNLLLWRDPSVDGIKTGHTSAAGYCLMASAKRGEQRLVTVVMGNTSENQRAVDSQALLNWGFRFYESHKLYEAGKPLAQPKVWKGEANQVAVGVSVPLLVSTPRGKYDRLKASMDLPKSLEAPIAKGQKLGMVKVALDGKIVASAPLVALQAVEEGGFFKRLWHSLLMWWQSV